MVGGPRRGGQQDAAPRRQPERRCALGEEPETREVLKSLEAHGGVCARMKSWVGIQGELAKRMEFCSREVLAAHVGMAGSPLNVLLT